MELKEAILKIFGELVPKRNGIHFISADRYVTRSLTLNAEVNFTLIDKHSGRIVTSIDVLESLPHSHHNWAIAATLLGIKTV